MLHGYGKNKTDGWVGQILPNNRLQIPPLFLGNGPQGFQLGGGECWPSSLGVGATFDASLADAFGDAMGRDFFLKGDNVLLGPGLNVIRIARDGRAFEYISGEDPGQSVRVTLALPIVLAFHSLIHSFVHSFIQSSARRWAAR